MALYMTGKNTRKKYIIEYLYRIDKTFKLKFIK